MLAAEVSSETPTKLNESFNAVKLKLSVLAKESAIGKRLVEAFGTDDKSFIAEKLGFSSVQAVYKVIKGERELDFEKLQNFRNYTKRSIDWLLTGSDPAPLPVDVAPVSVDDLITDKIRDLIRVELDARAMELQDLGTIDRFDIEAAVRKYDNAIPVLQEWYEHDGLTSPQFQALAFSGWDKMSIEEKVKEIRAVRGIVDRQQYRKKYVSPKTS